MGRKRSLSELVWWLRKAIKPDLPEDVAAVYWSVEDVDEYSPGTCIVVTPRRIHRFDYELVKPTGVFVEGPAVQMTHRILSPVRTISAGVSRSMSKDEPATTARHEVEITFADDETLKLPINPKADYGGRKQEIARHVDSVVSALSQMLA